MPLRSQQPLPQEVLDFAPGLLSIQESPPARLSKTVLYSVLALVSALLLWALVGKLDIVASAPGRLVPQTYVKIVQPADAGTVREIRVREGQAVQAGEVLILMDATVSQADARTVEHDLELKRLQLRRIDAELASVSLEAAPGDSASLFAQVHNQYLARRAAFQDALAQERAVLEKTRHDAKASGALLRKLQEAVPSYGKSAKAFESLGNAGFYSPLAVEEKQREHLEKAQDLRAQEASVASVWSAVAASEMRLAQIASNYRSDLQNERVETQSQYQRLVEEDKKSKHKASQLVLRAPQQGVIKELATHTIGAVVAPGTVLMSLVPHEEPLHAEILVRNEDVGFVHEGQRVKVKLAAYPFQKYGMIDGLVSHLGPDTAEETSAASQAGTTGAGTEPQLGYKALVDLKRQYLEVDGRRLHLTAGMQVVAEVHQGRRTVVEYLLSPVQKAWQEAGRER